MKQESNDRSNSRKMAAMQAIASYSVSGHRSQVDLHAAPQGWSKRIGKATSIGASIAFALAVIGAASAHAAAIDILWYTYANPLSEYRTTGVPGLAARSAGDPNSSGLTWNVTYWQPNDPVPDFSSYNLLFIETGEAFRTGPVPGPPYATPDYSGILNNAAAISAARGDRTFIDGADAEFHAIRGDTGNSCAPLPPRCGLWDGAVGHVVNAINWAGSGNALGVFASFAGEFLAAPYWWNDPNSFLRDELGSSVAYFHDNAPVLNAVESAYPINQGLTAQGLSNWSNSFHAGFRRGLAGYTEVVGSTLQPDYSLAIATTAWVNAATFPAPAELPEPASYALVLAGLAAFASMRRPGAGTRSLAARLVR